MKTETPGGVIGWCIAPLDIAYNKAEAGRPKDIIYLAGLFKERIVLPSQIKLAMDAAGSFLIGGSQNQSERDGAGGDPIHVNFGP